MPSINDHSPEEFLEAFREDPTNAPLALFAGAALDRAGREEEAVAIWTYGEDVNPALRSVWRDPAAQGEMRDHSKRADEAIRRHFTGLHHQIVNNAGGAEIDRVRNGIWAHYATAPFDYKQPLQRPEIFYMPDLDPKSVYQNDEISFAKELDAAYADIRAEWEAALAANVKQFPYVPESTQRSVWDELGGKMDWSALYLHFNASVTDEANHFPKTLQALENVPLVKRDGVPLETFFSRLIPGTKIPPHFGLTNTRLTMHYPVRIPSDCAIRVGEEMCSWQEGKLIGFDDSYEHEAWNKSQDDRVVMIFETHHPDLSLAEIDAIEKIYAGFHEWVTGRVDMLGVNPKKFIHPDAGGIA